MSVYRQHLVPMAMAPQHYAYMSAQPRPGQEAGGMPLGTHMGAPVMPQGPMQMYGYPTQQVLTSAQSLMPTMPKYVHIPLLNHAEM